MEAWSNRPIEISNLFNPAFCLLIIKSFLDEYQKKTGKGIDYILVFLILPIVLHKNTRAILPKTTNTKMHSWIQNNQEVKISIIQRIDNLAEFTKESIIYGMQLGIIGFDENGRIVSKKVKLAKTI